jgi:hypothetical protein
MLLCPSQEIVDGLLVLFNKELILLSKISLLYGMILSYLSIVIGYEIERDGNSGD